MAYQTQPSGTHAVRNGMTSLAPVTGTQMQTQTQTPPSRPILVLRAAGAETRHIQWAEDVVDNEGMGKKSSKVCCIYHKPHSANESSEDESSSSDSDSDSEPDTSKARPAGGLKERKVKKKHGNNHEHAHDDKNGESSSQRRSSPNAYERLPKYNQAKQSGPSESKS